MYRSKQTLFRTVIFCLIIFAASVFWGYLLGVYFAEYSITTASIEQSHKNQYWSFYPQTKTEGMTPYERALLSHHSLLKSKKEQKIYYITGKDSNGNPLLPGKTYRVTGRQLPARWWSLTVYDPLNLIPNKENKYSLSKKPLVKDENGNWQAFISFEKKDYDNWIPSTKEGNSLVLVLRLYHPEPIAYEKMEILELPKVELVEEE